MMMINAQKNGILHNVLWQEFRLNILCMLSRWHDPWLTILEKTCASIGIIIKK